MIQDDPLLVRLDALEARIAILEAERASRQPRMTYNWHRDDYQPPRLQPVYEYYMDPSMRETRNG
jgi:hypothetical protein